MIALAVLLILLWFVIRYLTCSERAAWVICVPLYAALLLAGWMAPEKLEGLLPAMMKQLSLFERFYVFVNGVFDMTGIVYFVSVIVCFLFLSVQSMEKRRYN